MTSVQKNIANEIIYNIETGCHKFSTICSNMEYQETEVRKVLDKMCNDGIVDYVYNELANECGYYMTIEGYRILQ